MKHTQQKQYNNPALATLTGILQLFKKRQPAGLLLDSDRLDGKTVFVDGSSSGLGFAIATGIAQRGARVIMACRSGIPEKGEEIIRRTGNKDVHMIHVDLSDLESIRTMVTELKSRFGMPDILILNAGMVPKQSRRTLQGMEEMFVVNYLAKFWFIRLLWPELTSSATGKEKPARIIFVASESHRNPVQFEWEDFGKYLPYTIGKTIKLYGYYKLLLITFAAELSRKLNRDGAFRCSVFALCPGPVNTHIAREAPMLFQPLLRVIFALFFRSPKKASIPVIYLAASKDEEGKAFDYLFLMERKEPDLKAMDPENGKKLWILSESLLPGI